ncbi:MAG: Hsp20/alpha crystallin family protein [Polyangiaceae bacterium]
MIEIDETIGQVEELYRALTGKEFPQLEAPYAPIPAEQDPSAHVKQQMDRLLTALAEPTSQAAIHAKVVAHPWTPFISSCETSSEYVVFVDLPGVGREKLEVTIDKGVLVISGQRAVVSTNGSRGRIVAEQPFGPFLRSVALPPGLKASEMTAQLKDGVLELRIPRNGESSSRTVPVA